MSDDLKEFRDAFESDDNAWEDIRKERKEDLRALSPEGPWPPAERKERQKNGRPCIHLDEIGQHVNQLVNDVRTTKRAIEVKAGDPDHNTDPKAAEAQAQFVSHLVRQIEYRSNAQQAYEQMFQDCAEGSFGFLRVKTKYVLDSIPTDAPLTAKAFDQEIVIEAIPNPNMVTPGYAVQPNLSDMQQCWVRESWTHAEFKQRFPNAEIKDFSHQTRVDAGPRWITENRVTVAERWQIKTRPETLVLLPGVETPEPQAFWKKDIPDEMWAQVKGMVLRERKVDQPYVCQTISNGIEALEKNEDWKGRYIPIIGCLGKVLWVDANGDGDTRQIHSLTRLMRDPQQLYDYYRTTEGEYVGLSPRMPWFAYKGSLDPENEAALQAANLKPVGLIQIETAVEGLIGTLPPLPQRVQAIDAAAINTLSMGAENARRSVQSASGAGFLPTPAQRLNEKSGVALKQIVSNAQKGSAHFIDHYEDALRHLAMVIVDLIPGIYDNARDLQVRRPDDKTTIVRVNDPAAQPHEEYGRVNLKEVAQFDVTIDTGPSFESQREKVSEFVDHLIEAHPELFAAFGAEAVEMKELGPQADALIEVLRALKPPQVLQAQKGQNVDPQMQQLQQQNQQLQMTLQQMQQYIQTEQMKQQGNLELKRLDGQIKIALAKLQGDQKLELQKNELAAESVTREDEQDHEMALSAAEAQHKTETAQEAATRAERQARNQALLGGGSKKVSRPS